MNEKKLIPKRRFSRFNEEWKTHKLEDLVEGFEYGLNASATSFDGINKYIRITDIDDETHVFLQNDLTSPSGNLNNADNYLLKTGDILFARTGASVGKTYCYDEKDGKVYFAGFLIRARTKSTFDAGFIFQNTLTTEYKKFVRVTSQRSGQPGINAREYAGFSLNVPSKSEQQKIGNFFKHLDQMISLEQRKLEKTKALKSAYLAEMFPAGGERVPKRRFPGFTGEWDEVKLKDISEIVGGGTPSSNKEEFWNGDIDWYSPTEIGNEIYANNSVRKITKIGYEKSSAKMLPADKTILFTSRAGIGSMAILKKQASTNQGFQSIVLKSGVDTYFIYSMGYLIKSYAISKSSGSTFLEISGKTLGEMPIVVPSFEEQLKIGEFFKKLDESITNNQQKLSKLKAMKLAYLEEMFV